MSYANIGGSWTVCFKEPPRSLQEIQSLAEGALLEPAHTAALLVSALCQWPKNKSEAIIMINFLKGPQPLSPYEMQFITERLSGSDYLPFSYFKGATPENGYQPEKPFVITVLKTPTSFSEPGYAQLYLKSGGADSPRPVKLRQRPSTGQWFLTEQMLLAKIRVPALQDPWA
jgi:hypothetical protein